MTSIKGKTFRTIELRLYDGETLEALKARGVLLVITGYHLGNEYMAAFTDTHNDKLLTAEADLAASVAREETLRKAIRQASEREGVCVLCGRMDHLGHFDDCVLAAAASEETTR